MTGEVSRVFGENLKYFGFTETPSDNIDISDAKITVYRALDKTLDDFPLVLGTSTKEGISHLYDTDEENRHIWEISDTLIMPSHNYLLKETNRFYFDGISSILKPAIEENMEFNPMRDSFVYDAERYGIESPRKAAGTRVFFRDRMRATEELLSRVTKEGKEFAFDFRE